MKKILTILTFFVFTIGIINAQTQDSLINDIRAKYKNIKNNLSNYNNVKKDIWGESTEGGEGIAYYDKNDIKLIVLKWFGESGKRIIEYYFDRNKLIFAFDRNFRYNVPIYMDKANAKKNGFTEYFDPEKTIILEDRYYFKNENLFLWLDNDKKSVDLTLEPNIKAGKNLIIHSKEMQEKLKK